MSEISLLYYIAQQKLNLRQLFKQRPDAVNIILIKIILKAIFVLNLQLQHPFPHHLFLPLE
jgi:hypothetical protein